MIANGTDLSEEIIELGLHRLALEETLSEFFKHLAEFQALEEDTQNEIVEECALRMLRMR